MCRCAKKNILWKASVIEMNVWDLNRYSFVDRINVFFSSSGMLNIHTLKSIRRPIITSSKSMDTKVMPVIHWMIHGMVQTIAHSRHTIVIMIEAHWTAPACLRYVYTLYQFAHFVYFCTRMPINRIKPVYFQCRVDGGGNLADEVWMDCIYTIHKI